MATFSIRSMLSMSRYAILCNKCNHHSPNVVLNIISRNSISSSSPSLSLTNRFNSMSSSLSQFQRASNIFFARSSYSFASRNKLIHSIRWFSNQSKSKVGNGASEEWKRFQKMSLIQKYKYMFMKYWYVAFPVHLVTSGIWFATLYIAARSGVDVKPILRFIKPYVEMLPLPDMIKKPLTDTEKETSNTAGYIALTLVMYKIVFLPRYATTVACTSIAIKILLRKGIIKPAVMPSRERMKQVFEESGLNIALKNKIRKNLAKRMKKSGPQNPPKPSSTKTTKR